MTLTEIKKNETKETSNEKVRVQVVKELPTQEIRVLENKETGEKTYLFTIEEALSLIIEKLSSK